MAKSDDIGRAARARMAEAEKASERQFGATDGGGEPQPRRPQRYKLYDRIASRVSVGAMNVIIIAVSALIILALIVGIVTGNPQ